MKIRKALVGLLCLCAIFAPSSLAQQFALRDFKNVYLEYNAKSIDIFFPIGKDVVRKYREEFVTKLSSVGFNVIEDAGRADVIIKCDFPKVLRKFPDVKRRANWVATGKVTVEVILPRRNLVLAAYSVGDDSWFNANFSMGEAEDMIMEKLKKDYSSGRKIVTVKPDGSAAPIQYHRKVPVLNKASLRDLKKAYVNFDIEYGYSFSDIQKIEAKDVEFAKILLRDAGFNIVDDPEHADVEIIFHGLKTAHSYSTGWTADSWWVDIIIPGSGEILKQIAPKMTDKTRSLKGGVEELVWGIRKELDSGTVSITTTADGKSIKDEKPRHVYVVFDREIIYEGDEKINASFWDDPKKHFENLAIERNRNSPRSMAVIVQKADPDIAPKISPGASIRNVVIPQKHRPANKILEKYGYLFRYDLKTRKVRTNFFIEFINSAKEFSNESSDDDVMRQQNYVFWRDLSYLLSTKVVSHFAEKGYKVLNLTPARKELEGMQPKDIVNKVQEKYGINEVIVVPFTAYTKIVKANGGMTSAEVGLFLCYNATIYNNGSDKPLFIISEDISAVTTDTLDKAKCKANFYSADESDLGEVRVLKDGVINDEWVVEKLLKKFSGTERGVNEKIKIGGKLFDELSNRGY